jgi:DNA polymerase III epsilon subunit-like protein
MLKLTVGLAESHRTNFVAFPPVRPFCHGQFHLRLRRGAAKQRLDLSRPAGLPAGLEFAVVAYIPRRRPAQLGIPRGPDSDQVSQSLARGPGANRVARKFRRAAIARPQRHSTRPTRTRCRRMVRAHPAGKQVVIGRTNAGVIGRAIAMVLNGDKVHFAGTRESDRWDPYVPYELQSLLDIFWLKSGRKELVQTAYLRSFSCYEQMAEHASADQELLRQVLLVKQLGPLMPDVIDAVRRQATSSADAAMSFSTAHRSKGREWRKVELLGDFFKIGEISPQELTKAKSLPHFREEMNLIYVAMTRACESNDYYDDLNGWLAEQRGQCEAQDSAIRSVQTTPTPMNNASWIILDTETDGLLDPIHVVEIAAQKMNGWDPVGEKFRVLLNHGVPMPPEATAVHGYTTEFLKQHGEDPLVAYGRFREFAGVLPVVAHNLSFDWNRALAQEWLRLGLEPIGQRGFCTLMLSRRLVGDCKSYRLDALRDAFQLSTKDAHRAFGDVATLVALFASVFRPKLEASGLETFEMVAEFSKRTPVAKCLSQIKTTGAKLAVDSPRSLLDRWYYIDPQNESHGPFGAAEILQRMGAIPCWVWQEGLADWLSSETCQEFQHCGKCPPPLPPVAKTQPAPSGARSVQELVGVCRGIIADGKITTAEVTFLSKWLQDAGTITEWPATEIAQSVEKITADGRITKEEKTELLNLLQRVCV